MAALFAQRIEAGNELQVAKALPDKEAVNLFNGACVPPGDDAENVIGRAVLFQQAGGLHRAVEGALSHTVGSVEIMDIRRPVQGKPRQEAVIAQEGGPFIVDQIAIGLNTVLDGYARLCVLLFKPEKIAVKGQAREGRLSALKGEGAAPFRIFHCGGNQVFGSFCGHHALEAALPVCGDVSIKAVAAIHIAGG